MTQTIYVVYGITKENQPVAICWHPNENIAKAHGTAVANHFGINFIGVSPCDCVVALPINLDEQDDYVTQLIVNKIKKLIDYICGLDSDLQPGEAAAIAAILIDGLPEVETLRPNIHNVAARIKQKRSSASVASYN